MTTQQQTLANRRNAELSTGPKTAEGKRRSAQNAISHGLLSRETLLEGEDPEVFADVWEQLLRELQPEGELETYLAGRIISAVWRMNRVARIEADLFNEPEFRFSGGPRAIGEIFRLERHQGSNAFLNLFRYEATVDRAFHRALHTLQLLQAARKKREAEPVGDWRETAGNSPDYETNPIERQAMRGADFPPNSHSRAFPPDDEAGPGAGFRGDGESSRNDDHSAGGGAEEQVALSRACQRAVLDRNEAEMVRARKRREAEPVGDGRETAGNSSDYETNPIEQMAGPGADFRAISHDGAFPLDDESGPGAGFRGDGESSRTGDNPPPRPRNRGLEQNRFLRLETVVSGAPRFRRENPGEGPFCEPMP